MTDTMEVVDLSTINVEDDAKCEHTGWRGMDFLGPNEQCEAAAEWVSHFECGHSQLLCSPHLEEYTGSYRVYCNCGHIMFYSKLVWHRV